MLRYFDRTGSAITRLRWEELLRVPSYTEVLLTERGRWRTVTTWVGVGHDAEARPLLFITRVYESRRYGNSERVDWIERKCAWSATEKEARQAHERLAREAK
jgi:hypothetical protein